MINYNIVEINDANISSVERLVEESITEGYTLGRRLLEEWRDGSNTFSKRGEKSWALFSGEQCVAIGGINIDPYVENNDGSIGRVRHVYVMKEFRGKGLSKTLMNHILEHAKKYFKTVRLSTRNPVAKHLYKSFGFVPTGEKKGEDRIIYSLDF